MKNQYHFKKNESFYIREGWFGKAIRELQIEENNVFVKNNGISILGIGSNMVKSLKFWLVAADIIDSKTYKLTEFGELIKKYDEYLEDKFTWFLINYHLVSKQYYNPIFWKMTRTNYRKFDRKIMLNELEEYFTSQDKNIKLKYISDDYSVYLKSFFSEESNATPEDNYICPLSHLKLLKREGDNYIRTSPVYRNLSYLVVFFVLEELYGKNDFNIEDSMSEFGSPCLVFNLKKDAYFQYLDEMRNNQLITINRTAGLNTVTIEKKLSISDIFERYFGGQNVQ